MDGQAVPRERSCRLRDHYHDLLNDVAKEKVIGDIKDWIEARVPTMQ